MTDLYKIGFFVSIIINFVIIPLCIYAFTQKLSVDKCKKLATPKKNDDKCSIDWKKP